MYLRVSIKKISVRYTDPRIWIRTKMSRIANTDKKYFRQNVSVFYILFLSSTLVNMLITSYPAVFNKPPLED